MRSFAVPYCPECGLEFPEGMSVCPDCSTELVDVSPQADQRDPYRDFKEIFICYSSGDALLVQFLLDGEGIPSLLSDIDQTERTRKTSEVRVRVPYEEVERASLLIEEALVDGDLRSVSGELTV
jgi:hypothetical protein